MALSNRQRAFINEYLRDFNGTRAAIRAGYSENGARVRGSELLSNSNIAAEIKARIDEQAMSSDEVLQRLADMARGDVADLMALTTMGYEFELMVKDENGDLVPNPKTKLIKKIKQKVTTIMPRNESGDEREIIETELELYDAQAALALLGKYHSLFIDRQDITSDGKRIRVTVGGDDVEAN